MSTSTPVGICSLPSDPRGFLFDSFQSRHSPAIRGGRCLLAARMTAASLLWLPPENALAKGKRQTRRNTVEGPFVPRR